jgi:hypothetical protein
MTENNKYSMEDLVVTAMQQQPMEFETAFNDLIIDRLQTAINDKKIAVAQQMYGYDGGSHQDNSEE